MDEWNNSGEQKEEREKRSGQDNYDSAYNSEYRYNTENGQYARGSQEYAYQTVMNNGRPKTMGWSLASMITGILSVVCCCFGWTGLIFGVAAIIIAIVSRKSLGYFDGMSIAGLILGIFGLVFGVAMIIMLFLETEFIESFIEEYNKAMDGVNGGNGGTNNGF